MILEQNTVLISDSNHGMRVSSVRWCSCMQSFQAGHWLAYEGRWQNDRLDIERERLCFRCCTSNVLTSAFHAWEVNSSVDGENWMAWPMTCRSRWAWKDASSVWNQRCLKSGLFARFETAVSHDGNNFVCKGTLHVVFFSGMHANHLLIRFFCILSFIWRRRLSPCCLKSVHSEISSSLWNQHCLKSGQLQTLKLLQQLEALRLSCPWFHSTIRFTAESLNRFCKPHV